MQDPGSNTAWLKNRARIESSVRQNQRYFHQIPTLPYLYRESIYPTVLKARFFLSQPHIPSTWLSRRIEAHGRGPHNLGTLGSLRESLESPCLWFPNVDILEALLLRGCRASSGTAQPRYPKLLGSYQGPKGPHTLPQQHM